MINYRIIKANDKALTKLGEENWQLICITDGKMYFSKKVTGKVDIKQKEAIKTKEWLEFYSIYKTIKNSGLSNNTLILKYNKLVTEGLHKTIIDNLKEYKLYLDVMKKQNYSLMASTYINQARYLDKWEIIQDMSRKFMNDIFKEKHLNKEEIEFITNEVDNRERTNNKEATDFLVREIIKKRLNK